MKIQSIDIQNFRKLLQCHIDFSEKTTLFVGANNSGKTSAMDALGKFLAGRDFAFNDITISKRVDINKIGEEWAQENCSEPTDLLEWESLVPQMDIWLNVSNSEIHYVAGIIPTLKWRSGKLGVRLAFFPKNIAKLFADYKEVYFAARKTEKAKGKTDINLYPKDLCEFIDRNLNTYFSIKAFVLDPAKSNADALQATAEQDSIEETVAQTMAIDTGDDGWKDKTTYKSLILEHHMAASRFGFSNLYMPLNDSKKFDTALRNGSITELSILAKMVLPLVRAYQEKNDFEVAKIVRKHSPLLDKKTLVAKTDDQAEILQKAENAVESLMELWSGNKIPSCLDVLRSIRDTGLFEVSSRTEDILAEQYEGESQKVIALRKALSASFSELERYSLYVTDGTTFATHQGVKGLEFPRVMVIMDDAQARGFLFSYEKLFGAKAKTDTDSQNEREGKDTSITRTARLFYVACTRAQNSLAVVAYTENADSVKSTALSNNWFSEEEIIVL